MTHVILDASVPFNWNGTPIHFNAWPDNAFGVYDYTTRSRHHRIDYRLRPGVNAVEIVLLKIDGRAPATLLPGTRRQGADVLLDPAQSIHATTVPQALLLLVIWAENVGFYPQGEPNA